MEIIIFMKTLSAIAILINLLKAKLIASKNQADILS